jgi:drug/metabolite transporter (DMT)-like permease
MKSSVRESPSPTPPSAGDFQRKALPYLVWVAIGLVWGTSWAVIRVGLRDLPPFTFAGIRTTLGALALVSLAIVAQPGRRPPAREVRFWLIVGVPQLGLPYAFIFWGEQTISSGLTALLFATFPTFTVLFSHYLVPEERLTGRRLGGTLLAAVAVLVLVNPLVGEMPPLLPVLAILGAAVSGSFGAVMVRRHGRRTSTLWLTALQLVTGAAFLLGLALVFERGRAAEFTPTAIASIVYLGLVVSVGCYLGLFWLLKRLDTTFVSMGVIFETFVAVTIGAAALGEAVGWRMAAGLVLVAISVVLVNRT